MSNSNMPQLGAVGSTAEKIVTPIIYGLIAALITGIALIVTVAEPGPALWSAMAGFGGLGFVSGVTRVRLGASR